MREKFECEIKRLESFEEFEKIFRVYSQFPCYEEWSAEEIRQEYENLKNGFLYGCYYEDSCVGLLTMCASIYCEHPMKFQDPQKVLFISHLLITPEYRYHGLGTALAEFAVEFARANKYISIYFSYREKQLGLRIAKDLGFKEIQGVYTNISTNRTALGYVEQYKKSAVRLFMSREFEY